MVRGLGPVGHLVLGDYPSAGPELRVVIAGVVAEFSPFAIGHLVLGDIERVDVHNMHGALPGFAIAEIVSHPEGAAGNVHEIAVPVVDNGRSASRDPYR